jgi:hypothetical protein
MTDTPTPPEFPPETYTALLEHYIDRLAKIGDQVLDVADHCAKNYREPYTGNADRLALCMTTILNTQRGIIRASESIERLKLARLRQAVLLDKKCAKNAKRTIQTPQDSVDLGAV